MLYNVVVAVGDRSLAHTKAVINMNAMHDKLHTHVVHLCRWLDAGSDQHVRGQRRVSADCTNFCRPSTSLFMQTPLMRAPFGCFHRRHME